MLIKLKIILRKYIKKKKKKKLLKEIAKRIVLYITCNTCRLKYNLYKYEMESFFLYKEKKDKQVTMVAF